jgi:hypothetical protein
MNAPDILRALLVVGMAGMALLALVYLSRRRLAWWQLCAWGVLALGLPVLGPFVVICLRPGGQPAQRRAAALRRVRRQAGSPRGLGRVI